MIQRGIQDLVAHVDVAADFEPKKRGQILGDTLHGFDIIKKLALCRYHRGSRKDQH